MSNDVCHQHRPPEERGKEMPQNWVEAGPGGHREKAPERGPHPMTVGRRGLRTTASITQEAGRRRRSQKLASPSPPRPVPQDPAPHCTGAQRPRPEDGSHPGQCPRLGRLGEARFHRQASGLLTFRVIAGFKDVQLMGVVCKCKHLNHGVQNHHNSEKKKNNQNSSPQK